MIHTRQRIQLLANASQHPVFSHLMGQLTENDLSVWLESELGNIEALDSFTPHGSIQSKAYPPANILHIVSGNTPHAAIQSLLRGLLLGSHNTIKLPSEGLPDLTTWVESLPTELTDLMTLTENIETVTWEQADAVIAIGSDNTVTAIQQRIQPHQIFIPHGHKVSIGIVTGDWQNAAQLAVQDVSLFDQRGCLSLHAIYVDEPEESSAQDFAQQLADAMAEFAQQNPPQPMSISEAGSIYHLRETTRFISANDPTTQIWESPGSLDWTVIYQQDPTLHLSCLGRTVFVKPLPKLIDQHTLGPESHYLSTIALHPFSPDKAETFAHLPAHRICPLGQSQKPSLFWHHDGFAPLASLIKWKDIG